MILDEQKLDFEVFGWYFDLGWDQKLYPFEGIYNLYSFPKEVCQCLNLRWIFCFFLESMGNTTVDWDPK